MLSSGLLAAGGLAGLVLQLGDPRHIDVVHRPGRLTRGRGAGGEPPLLLALQRRGRHAGGLGLTVGPAQLALGGAEGAIHVLRSLRVSKVKTPILILSGLAGIEDKVKGLGFGADDYMTKPFHKDELIARIHAIVRRSKGHAQSVINTGDLIVNLDTKTVEVNGARVHLTGKEYQMLELLSLRKGTTLTKEMFLNHLYGGMDEPELKIIDVFICKLRKKLANASSGKNYIETVWGRGYVLREPSDDEARIPA